MTFVKQLAKTLKNSFNPVYKQDGDRYEDAAEDGALAFRRLVNLYFIGEITLQELDMRFRSGLEEHYVRMMLLAIDGTREVTEEDLEILQHRLDREYEYLDGFIEDIRTGRMTQQRALWRAGLYGFARAAYVNFSVPTDIADLMPQLPGDDCLGGSLCGCSLNVEFDTEGTAYVYWIIDPAKESCPVCIGHAIESPYVFSKEEIANAR